MPYLTEEEYNELEKELAWYKSLHATTMTRTWDEVAFELRAEIAELKHLLFLATAPLEKIAGSQHVPNMTAELASDALALIRAQLAKES